LAQSQSDVHGQRLAENDACHDALENQAQFKEVCGADCDADALCEGRWKEACPDGRATSPGKNAPVRQTAAPSQAASIRPTLDERLLPVWKLVTIL
jgi:hypothetical protein